jgi:putative ABC transport system permease protein
MKYFPLIWAGMWRKRTRTVFTLLSIVVAFLLYGLLQGVDAWLSGAIEGSRINRLYTVSRISFIEPLPASYTAQIESVPGVDKVAYFNWFGGYYQDPKQMVVSYPIDPERTFAVMPDWIVQPADAVQKMTRQRDGAIIGAQLARRFGWKVGDRVPLKTSIWTKKDGSSSYDFEIVGTFTGPQENLFLLNYEYFNEARSFGQNNVGWFALTIKDPTQAAKVSRDIDALFANSPNETKTQTEKEFAAAQVKQLGDIGFMVNAIVGAVMFTLLFLTGNTMMQSVRERIPELAVLKTVGFSDGKVTALVLAESILLCVFAALIGLGLAAMIFPAAGSLGLGKVVLPGIVLVSGTLAALALALVSGLPPAIRAKRLAVVDALAGR